PSGGLAGEGPPEGGIPTAALPEPTRSAGVPAVPGFDALEEIGRGGMGGVYAARQQSLDRGVALKGIRPADRADAREKARFRREALAAARLQHPNVVQVFEVGEYAGLPYLVMEHVGGGTLARHGGAPLEPRQAAALVEAVARAVHMAHQAGIVHR